MTSKIRDQILTVRDDGRTNMLDTNGVMYYANELNLFDLVVYLDDRDNRKEYWNFIMTGQAEITDDDDNSPEKDDEPDCDPEDDSFDDEWDDEEDSGPPPTRAEMKAEAIKRLQQLNLGPEIIQQFKEHGEIYSCTGLSGLPVPADIYLKEQIRQLEAEYGFMVFLCIHAEMLYDSMDCLLIVSKYREEWEMETSDIEDGYAMTYTINHDHPECSEMGSIGFHHNKYGGIVRTA